MRWLVTGQIFLADGFDIEIEADTEAEAERLVKEKVENDYLNRPDLTCEIQEVCINSTVKVEE